MTISIVPGIGIVEDLAFIGQQDMMDISWDRMEDKQIGLNWIKWGWLGWIDGQDRRNDGQTHGINSIGRVDGQIGGCSDR